MTRLIKRVDDNGSTTRVVAADDETTGLLDFPTQPGKEGCQRRGVENTLAAEAVDASRQCREVAVEHPERARLDLAERGAGRRANPFGALLQGVLGGRNESDVDGNVKRLLLAGGQATLQVL